MCLVNTRTKSARRLARAAQPPLSTDKNITLCSEHQRASCVLKVLLVQVHQSFQSSVHGASIPLPVVQTALTAQMVKDMFASRAAIQQPLLSLCAPRVFIVTKTPSCRPPPVNILPREARKPPVPEFQAEMATMLPEDLGKNTFALQATTVKTKTSPPRALSESTTTSTEWLRHPTAKHALTATIARLAPPSQYNALPEPTANKAP